MFHTTDEPVALKIQWKNHGRRDVRITWSILDGDEGETLVRANKDSPEFDLSLPESKVSFTFNTLDPLAVEWTEVDSEGRFHLQDPTQAWEVREFMEDGAVLGLATSNITFNRSSSDTGILIVGILDIGGGDLS